MTKSREWQEIAHDEIQVIEKFIQDAPVKVGAMAKALGLEVLLSSLHPGISGQITPNERGGYVIKINRNDSKQRQRFTVAHEIAHFLLHKELIGEGITDNTLYRSNQSSAIEAQANRLAADLLMPWDQLEKDLKDLKKIDALSVEEKVVKLSDRYNVSTTAMKVRLGLSQ